MKSLSLAMILAVSVVGWGQSAPAKQPESFSAIVGTSASSMITYTPVVTTVDNQGNPLPSGCKNIDGYISCEDAEGKNEQVVIQELFNSRAALEKRITALEERVWHFDQTAPPTYIPLPKLCGSNRNEQCIEGGRGNGSGILDIPLTLLPDGFRADPSIPIVTREPVYKETKTCQDGWHLEVWQTMYEGTTGGIYHPVPGYYTFGTLFLSHVDSENELNVTKDHPDKCFQDNPTIEWGACKGDCPPGGDRTTSADSKKCSDSLSDCDEGVRDFPVKPVSPKPQPKPCVDEEFNFNSDEGYTPVFMSCDANGDNCDTNSDRFDRVVVCKRFSSGESIDKAIRFCTDEEWKYMKPAIKMCKSNPPKPCPKVITGDMTVDCENVPKK